MSLKDLNDTIEKTDVNEISIKNILDTSMWIDTGNLDTYDMKGIDLKTVNFDKSKGPDYTSIMNAIVELIKVGAYAERKNNLLHSNVWLVELPKTERGDPTLQSYKKFINDKTYILNPSVRNSFIFPELKYLPDVSSGPQLNQLTGGSMENNTEIYELINYARINLNNISEMNGGSLDVLSEGPKSLLDGIEDLLYQGKLDLGKDDYKRLIYLLRKYTKYNERINALNTYLHYYNKLPEDKKNPSDILKSVEDFDSHNRVEYNKVTTDLLQQFKNMIDGKKESTTKISKVPEYHKKNLSEFDYSILGEELLFIVFEKVGDQAKTNFIDELTKNMIPEKDGDNIVIKPFKFKGENYDKRNIITVLKNLI